MNNHSDRFVLAECGKGFWWTFDRETNTFSSSRYGREAAEKRRLEIVAKWEAEERDDIPESFGTHQYHDIG